MPEGRSQSRSDAPVCTNLWGFHPAILPLLRERFAAFLAAGPGPGREFYLSEAINDLIVAGQVRCTVLPTRARWLGVTFPGDHAGVAASASRHGRIPAMQLAPLDWIVVALYGLTALAIGLRFARRAGSGADEFFLSGRKLPWWLLGTSMVATTFSTDTPNLIADFVRGNGVAQNWSWWAFLITGMCTVFFYARLWRRSGALTDIEFYELRYSGRAAAFLRGFRALYLGVFYNVMIIATVTLAATKIGGVLLGLDPLTTVLIAGSVTVIYSATSGLWGVVVTDLVLFVVAMIGSIAAAFFALQQPEVGGLAGLVSHPELQSAMRFLPDFSNWSVALGIFIIPVAVQWWSAWYPGSEPGGGGYIAQRMLAAKDEKEAMKATLWFNIAHYGLRPWPWIVVALCSMLVYPELSDIQARFPDLDPSLVGNDLAYPAMLVFLPAACSGWWSRRSRRRTCPRSAPSSTGARRTW